MLSGEQMGDGQRVRNCTNADVNQVEAEGRGAAPDSSKGSRFKGGLGAVLGSPWRVYRKI